MSAPSTGVSTPTGTKLIPDPPTHPAYKLIARAHPNDQIKAIQIYADKVAHKPLFLDSSSHDVSDKRSARRRLRLRKKSYALKHTRPKPLSAKEKRELKLYELRPEECKYEIYKGLNTLWKRYMLEVLGYLDREGKVVKGRVGSAASASGAGALIASADFHGMEIEVVRCVDVGRVGLKGIVVRETRSIITVVCDEREDELGRRKRKASRKGNEDIATGTDKESRAGGNQDKVRMVLKKGTVFRVVLDLPGKEETSSANDVAEDRGTVTTDSTTTGTNVTRQLVFGLHGDQLEIRPIERATKKFKWKPMDYL